MLGLGLISLIEELRVEKGKKNEYTSFRSIETSLYLSIREE